MAWRRTGPQDFPRRPSEQRKTAMNSIIYLVGLVVVVLFILGMLGLR
ncbi:MULTISPECIES: hypothetical protein [Paracoccus]|nr:MULTISPECIES: hypothetical protein [Paracoccus]